MKNLKKFENFLNESEQTQAIISDDNQLLQFMSNNESTPILIVSPPGAGALNLMKKMIHDHASSYSIFDCTTISPEDISLPSKSGMIYAGSFFAEIVVFDDFDRANSQVRNAILKAIFSEDIQRSMKTGKTTIILKSSSQDSVPAAMLNRFAVAIYRPTK